MMMEGYSQGGHNTIYDDSSATLTISVGNAETMLNHASGGYNYLTGTAYTSVLYGDAELMNGDPGAGGGPGVFGGHNTLVLDSAGHVGSYESEAFGDAQQIQGFVQGGYNTIYIDNGGQAVFGDAQQLNAEIFQGGHNTIYCTGSQSAGTVNSIYGDCQMNGNGSSGAVGGYNTIYAGSGNSTIYGDCAINQDSFTGGNNTIYCGTGINTIWGGTQVGQEVGGHNSFVFAPGSGQDTIMDFDQNGGQAFNQAQGDVINLTAYHLNPTFGAGGIVVSSDNHGNAIIDLPSHSSTDLAPSTITLIGVNPAALTLSDFLL